MSGFIGGVSGPIATGSSPPVNQGSQGNSNVGATHSEFGPLIVSSGGPASSNFLEEASITVSSLRKFETKDDKKDKDLKKALERLKETVPDIPGMEKMDKLLRQLQEAKKQGNLTESQIRESIQEYSGDPTHQYLAMEALINHLQGTDESEREMADALKEYNIGFYENNKKDIQSGINVSAAAAEYAENNSYGSVQELRDIWRQGLDVPDFDGPLQAYLFAKDQCGYNQIDKGITWLRESISTELQSLTSSVDPNQLNHVRSRLEVVFGLQTMIEFSKNNESAVERMSAQNKGT